MAIEEINQELWELAVGIVKKQQEEAFESLFAEAVEEHLKGECPECKEELSSNCEKQIRTRIEEWQEEQFDDQMKAEYDFLEERWEEQWEEQDEAQDEEQETA